MKGTKLTRRGKRVRAILIGALLVGSLLFISGYHKAYGNCHYQGADKVCSLIKWERDK